MGVAIESYALDVGLQPHGSFRELMVNEDFVQGVWPLSDLDPTSSRIVDISGYRRHGTLLGTGTTRGVSVDLPEGALGIHLSGGGSVFVPHTDDLSLPGGSVDIMFLMRTSTSDGSARYIVFKQGGTDGYAVALVSGAISFQLTVGSSNVFLFSRGAVADGAWHLVHCCYEPEESRARILIDGVQSGAAVTGVTIEPALNANPLIIGGFLGASSTDRYIGDLAYVMVGREGNPALSPRLQATRVWTSIASDTRAGVAPLRFRSGIQGSSIIEDMAAPGSLFVALDNSARGGAQGRYTPGHAQALAGWRSGIPARYAVTYGGVTYYKWRGFVADIDPLPGQYHSQYVTVTCGDWLDVAAQMSLLPIPTQTNTRSDHYARIILDRCEGQVPASVRISAGSSTFMFCGDVGSGDEEPLLTELARSVSSERGFCYIRGNTTGGGELVIEGRGDRQVHTTLDATLLNTMHGLTVEYGKKNIVNFVRVIVTKRRVDPTATTALFTLTAGQHGIAIAPGAAPLVLEGGYRDPTQEAASVSGTDMAPPEAGTDYGFWSNSDGTGIDLSAHLDIVADLGGTSFRIECTNTGTQVGYLRLNASSLALQLRGRGIYHFSKYAAAREDRASIRRNGHRRVRLDLAYESDPGVAESIADFIKHVFADERPVPRSVSFIANDSDALMTMALEREVGDKIGLVETMTGVATTNPMGDTPVGYFIRHIDWTHEAGGLIRVTWSLVPSAPTGAAVFDESAYDEDSYGY